MLPRFLALFFDWLVELFTDAARSMFPVPQPLPSPAGPARAQLPRPSTALQRQRETRPAPDRERIRAIRQAERARRKAAREKHEAAVRLERLAHPRLEPLRVERDRLQGRGDIRGDMLAERIELIAKHDRLSVYAMMDIIDRWMAAPDTRLADVLTAEESHRIGSYRKRWLLALEQNLRAEQNLSRRKGSASIRPAPPRG